jgi:pimeloyl-ACP methyl ester carboxylesterase
MERPVTFVNRNGFRLFGMLYLPERTPSRRIGIVISVNAVKYRLGTFRLHVLLARALSELGYCVLSFDPEGIGDSEGEFEYKLLSEHYYDIQTGKYSNDLSDAIDFFYKECGLDSLLLLGLCGGAISVLMEAGNDERVSGLILLNIPVLVEDLKRQGQVDSAAMITSSESASGLLKAKLQRVTQWNFWRRLVRLEVDLREESRLVAKAASVLVSRVAAKASGLTSARRRAAQALAQPVSANRLYNMHFQTAFARSMTARKRIYFLFAEFDQWTWIFKSEFQDLVLTPGNRFEAECRIEVIGGANHIFSGRESQKELETRIVNWLSGNFPVTLAPQAAPVTAAAGARALSEA